MAALPRDRSDLVGHRRIERQWLRPLGRYFESELVGNTARLGGHMCFKFGQGFPFVIHAAERGDKPSIDCRPIRVNLDGSVTQSARGVTAQIERRHQPAERFAEMVRVLSAEDALVPRAS